MNLSSEIVTGLALPAVKVTRNTLFREELGIREPGAGLSEANITDIPVAGALGDGVPLGLGVGVGVPLGEGAGEGVGPPAIAETAARVFGPK